MINHDTIRELLLGPLFGLLAWAAAHDAATRRLPNWLTFSVIVSGLFASFMPLHLVTPMESLAGILAGAALPLVMFILGALGGGDVKLMAGVGAWLGPRSALLVFVVAALAGMVIVLVQSIAQGTLRALLRNSVTAAINVVHVRELGADHVAETGRSLKSIARPLPYAVPVLIATLTVATLF